jgi:hypothetical protein
VAIPYFVSDELDFFSELPEVVAVLLVSELEDLDSPEDLEDLDSDDSPDFEDPFPDEEPEFLA